MFAHHISILDEIEETMRKAEVKYIRIDGSTKNEHRQSNVDIFQKDDSCLVAILSITACATGITMTKASTVVFAEMYFTPSVMIQAEDRAHRIGQEHTCVNIHYLFGPKTLDELIYQKLHEKHFVVTETLDNKKLVMDIQKLTNGRIGDFEVKISSQVDSQQEQEHSIPSQSITKKLMKKGAKVKIEDYFLKQSESKNNPSKLKTPLEKIEEKKEIDEDLTNYLNGVGTKEFNKGKRKPIDSDEEEEEVQACYDDTVSGLMV